MKNLLPIVIATFGESLEHQPLFDSIEARNEALIRLLEDACLIAGFDCGITRADLRTPRFGGAL